MLNFNTEENNPEIETRMRHFVRTRRRFMRRMSFMVFVITVMSVCIAVKLGCFDGLEDSLSRSAETLRSLISNEQPTLM